MIRIGLMALVIMGFVVMGAHAGMPEPSQLMRHKASSVLISQWETAGKRQREQVWVECFLRLTGAMTPAMRDALESAGVAVRSVIPEARERQQPATLVTARVRLADLPAVAALHFIEQIDGAARVGLKPVMTK